MVTLYRSAIVMLLLVVTISASAQTTSTQAGSDGIWSTAANWDNGVPANNGTVLVNKDLSFGNTSTSLNITTGGYYTIDANVEDDDDRATLQMNGGTLDVKSGTFMFGGGVPFSWGCFCNPLNSGTIYIRSGATLVLGGDIGVTFGDDLNIVIETGGTLVVERIVVNNATIQNNGSIIYGLNWGGSGNTTGSGTSCTTGNTPNASIASSNSPVCVGATINLTGTTVSGATSYKWTGPNGYTYTSTTSPNTTRTGATTTMAGTYTLTVTKSGCSKSSSTIIRVGVPAQPSAIVAGNTAPCKNSTGNTYSVINVAGVSYAWAYSGTGATITSGANTSTITVSYSASASAGSWTVTPSNSCGNGTTRTYAVSFGAGPAQPSIVTAGNTSPCKNSTGNTYSVTNVAGVSCTWTYGGTGATITSGNGTNAITVSYSASATTGSWTVTPSNSCGNGTVRTYAVTFGITPAQPSAIIAGNASPCKNSTGNTYSVTNVSGVSYAWSYSGTGASITSGTGTNAITVSYSASATTGSWTVRPSNSCGNGTTRTYSVTFGSVPAQPSTITAGNTSPCKNSTGNTYSVTNVSGVSYAWSYSGTGATITSGTGTNAITVSYSASATTGSWTVRPSNSCGNGTTRTYSVTFGSTPAQPSTITAGNTSPCKNSTGNTYSVTNVSGVTYTWTYGGTGATITAGSGTNAITVTYSTSATAGSWTVRPSICGNGPTRTYAVTFGTAPAQTSAITAGNEIPCKNSTGNTYSVTNVSGVSYAWSYSGTGASITSGTGTNAITVSYSASATTGSWTVTPSNSCGNGTVRTLAVTFTNGVPTQPSAITASSAMPCRGTGGYTYTVTNVPGTTYTWTYSGNGETITSGNGTNTITVSYGTGSSTNNGNWTVVPSNSCGNGPSQTLAVTLTSGTPSRPGAFTTAASNPCANSTGNIYTIPNTAGITYNWTYSGSGATITSGAGTNSITVAYAAATSGEWSVTASTSCGTSNNARTTSVNISAAPAQPSTITASNSSPCKGSSGITYSVSNVPGLSYAWSYSGTGASITSGITTRTITVSYSASATNGTWTVIPSNGTCTGPARTLAVTLNASPAQPSAIAAGNASPCKNSTGNTYSVNNIAGVSYAWIYSGTGANITSGAGTNAITVSYSTTATSGSWTVTPSNSCGNGSVQTLAVTLNTVPAQPSAITAGNASPCKNSTGNTYAVSNVAGVSYAWGYSGTGANITSGSGTNSITVTYSAIATSGSWTVTPSNSCGGTGSSQSLSITLGSVPSQPSVISASNSSPCVNSTGITYSVTNVAGINYAWSYSGTGATITSGNNTNAITVSYAVTATSGNWSVTPSSSCGNGTAQVIAVSIVPCTYTWDGSTDTDWETAANWSDNAVPSSGNDVLIPSGPSNMPIISGSAESRNLTVQTGATLHNNLNGNLSIAGNFTNSGVFSDTGTVVLNGNNNQTVAGISSFNNLTLDNASGAKINNNLTIKGALTLTQGVFNPNGNLLTINLNSGSIAGEGTGSISQPIKLIKTCGTKWHHIGSPLGGTTVLFSQLTEHITVAKGVLYKYDETDPSTIMEDGWIEIPTTSFNSTAMVPMIGYNMYVWPKRTTFDVVGMYNHNFSTSVSLTETSSGESLSDGWNFLSNPYPSTIDWDAASGWNKSGVDDAIYVRDKSNNQYMSYINGNSTNGGSQYISSMQGFWVKCNSATGNIGINKNARVISPVLKLYKGQSTGVIKMRLSSSGYADESIITFNNAGTSNFDPSLDAYKLKNSGSNPNISSQLNGVEYSINTISDTINDIIVPLKVTTAFPGQYNLKVSLNNMPSDIEVVLIDKESNDTQDLTFDDNYVFTNSSKDTSRFFIRLKKKENVATGLVSANNNNVFMGSDGSVVTISLNTNEAIANMTLLNLVGNEVYNNEKVTITGGLIREEIDLHNSGIYIIKLKVGDQTYTGRVFIK